MTDDELKQELTRLEPFEGRVPWLYQDNAVKPNVTTGVGFLIASVDDACRLPWYHLSDGLPATNGEVASDFFRVKSLRGGLLATAYKGLLRLAPDDIDQEGFRLLRVRLAALPALFPGYDDFPAGVQACLLDLAWNVGLGALHKWHGLLSACNAVPPDYLASAKECATANPNHSPNREARNAWRAQCFLDAANA